MRGCECDGNAGVEEEGGVVTVSPGYEYVGGTRGSGIVPSVTDVLGMRGVGGVCEMCMCLARAVWEVNGSG